MMLRAYTKIHLCISGTTVLSFWVEDHVPVRQIESILLSNNSPLALYCFLTSFVDLSSHLLLLCCVHKMIKTPAKSPKDHHPIFHRTQTKTECNYVLMLFFWPQPLKVSINTRS